MLPYLIHVSLLLSGCFIFYWLLISKETFFRLNRWVLISSILLSVTVPLIPVPEGISFRALSTSEAEATTSPAAFEAPSSAIVLPQNNEENNWQETVALNPEPEQNSQADPLHTDIGISASLSEEISESQINTETKTWYSKMAWGSLLWYGYLMGITVFTLAFFVQLFVVVARMISLESIRDGRFKIVELVKDEAPYSFWNTIFINPSKYDPNTYQQIIEHEKIHIQQAHFIDKLIAEFLVIVFWFNPFAWLFRRAITNNLEYLTDSSMLEVGTEKQTYQLSLLKVSVPQYPLNLTTNYNSSFLKSRIAMMNAKKSSARSSWKYLFLLPLVLFSMLCLNEVQSKKAELLAEMQETESLLEQATPSEQANPNVQATPEARKKDKQKHKDKNKNKQKTKSKSKKNSDAMSFTMTSGNSEMSHNYDVWNGDLGPGEWEGEIEGNKVCLQLNTSRPAMGYRSYNSVCFNKSEFSEIPIDTDKDFYIQREAGKLLLNGSFTGSFGDGTFEYEPDAAFTSYLSKEGINIREEKQLHLFMADIDKSYVSYLSSEGFKADGNDLVELAIHGVDQEKVKDYVQLFKDLDYKGYRVRDLIQFEIHDVDPEYVNAIRAMGMTDLSVQDVVQARIHDVEPGFIKSVKDYGFTDVDLQDIIQFSIHDVDLDYIETLKNAGYRDLSHQDIIQASIHDVDPDFIQEMTEAGFQDMDMQTLIQFSIHDVDLDYLETLKNAGYRDLSHRDIIQASIHDVDPEYIKEMTEAGFQDMDMQTLIQFSIHDIDADYIKSFKAAGLDVSERDIIQAGIHDVDIDFVKSLQANGMKDLDMEEIVQLAIHDVDADYLNEMKALGYNNLSRQDIIQASIHDVDADYVRELKAAGLDDLDIEDVVQFSIHDIEVEDIKAFKSAGFDMDNRDIIQAGIHDVSATYIKEMRAMGFEDEDLEAFIQAKIHGVNPSFVKRAREKGHNPKTLKEYVRLKIGGI